MKPQYLLFMIITSCILFTACRHKDLCYNHPHDASVRIDTDWSNFTEEEPTGMTVMVYSQDGDQTLVATQHTNTTTHATFALPEGYYSAIVYNQSHTEFGSLLFRGTNKFTTHEVYARPTTTRWYTRGDKTHVVTEPEWLGTDEAENLHVTAEMARKTTHELMSKDSRNVANNAFLIGTLHPDNIIYTLHVKVHVKGIYNLRSARASLDGLAEGYFMGLARPSAQTVAQLLEEWTIVQNPSDPTQGYIETSITCFGLPYGHMGHAEENIFELQTLLVDNKTILKYPFHVGDVIERKPEDTNLSLYLELKIDDPLPDVEPADTSDGGFSAVVDDWGPEENVNVNM